MREVVNMDIEPEAPRVANPSDAVDLISTLMELVEGDTSEKGRQLRQGLDVLRDAIERGII
ncbi:hypothetical protein AGMMS49991_04600 [Spirochaetia bacterium]|nr:hypothetical protein AGMMS49991_04600 [Spirochaetia bacterium]